MQPVARHSLTLIQTLSLIAILVSAYMILGTWEFLGALGLSGIVASLYAERSLMEDD